MGPAAEDWYRLVLYPRLGPRGPGAAELARSLAEVGLRGEPFSHRGKTYYRTGEAFLDLVTFLGCSPVIELAPLYDAAGEPDMGRFCHVGIVPASASARFWLGDARARPRCPGCRTPLENWRRELDGWSAQPEATVVRCPQCGALSALAQLSWRRAAAVAWTFVEIGGIHPQEAIPTEGLLTALERTSGGRWDYFYAERGVTAGA